MPGWTRKLLAAAAIYYLILGLSAIFWPRSWYVASGLYPVNAEVVMAALGATLLAFSVAAAIALFMARSQWALIIILFFHNLFDLLIVTSEISAGRLGIVSGTIFALVDLGWLGAFGVLLFTLTKRAGQSEASRPSLESALLIKPIGTTLTLGELSREKPLLLILVRHSGCTFCRSHLATVAAEQRAVLEKGFAICVVSMSPPEEIETLRGAYPIEGAFFVSDPERKLYRALGAERGSLRQLFGPKELWRGLIKGEIFKHGLGEVSGDPAQLGGTFIIKDGGVVFSKPATSAGEVCPITTALASV
ncbi:MAG: hypothetical protein RL417_1346 [Pseudomonadota bacterium]|jgi:hypothetical protein